MTIKKISAVISPPLGSLDILSQHEVSKLRDASKSGLHDLFRRCALAVLNSGVDMDDALELMEMYADFDVHIIQQDYGLKLEVVNAPTSAFVDGKLINGIRELLFTVLRDILYVSHELEDGRYDLSRSEGITNIVFHILRNARVLRPQQAADIVTCWGGHSIKREEYDYSKQVGYELGLRQLNICTGCGPGAMKGPMKGATIAHAKQRIHEGRYIGISEPGIIATEPPNPIVNELVIMPDIEKRLEAFVRISYGVVIFPGGVGTTEEILYLLGVLLHPANGKQPLPVVLTGPSNSAEYFACVDDFIGSILGKEAQQRYEIIIGDPRRVAKTIESGMQQVVKYRKKYADAFYFNWGMYVDLMFQSPFDPTHANMANLNLHYDQPTYELASNLRRAFSGLVAGNVKEQGIAEVKRHGPFKLHGDATIVRKLDRLLEAFVTQGRMKLPGAQYVPCYQLIT